MNYADTLREFISKKRCSVAVKIYYKKYYTEPVTKIALKFSVSE